MGLASRKRLPVMKREEITDYFTWGVNETGVKGLLVSYWRSEEKELSRRKRLAVVNVEEEEESNYHLGELRRQPLKG